jgi:hypothetical protein
MLSKCRKLERKNVKNYRVPEGKARKHHPISQTWKSV